MGTCQLGRLKRAGAKGGDATGPNPTDRGKPGTKRHLVVDAQGIPLIIQTSAANTHEVSVAEQVIDAIPSVRGRHGRPRKRPGKLHADKAYSSAKLRGFLRERNITPRIARLGIELNATLGKHRWVVERTSAWLNQNRRLRIRYERRKDIHDALLTLGCILICTRFC